MLFILSVALHISDTGQTIDTHRYYIISRATLGSYVCLLVIKCLVTTGNQIG